MPNPIREFKPGLRTNQRTAPSYAVGEQWANDGRYRTIVAINGREDRGYSSNRAGYFHEVHYRDGAGILKKSWSDDFRRWMLNAARVSRA